MLKLTPSLLAKALRKVLKLGWGTAKLPFKAGRAVRRRVRRHRQAKEARTPHGKMTVKELAAKDRGLQAIEDSVTKETLRDFSRIAKKYGVDFAPYKVKGEDKYTIFFKGPDTDAISAAFQEYSAREIKKARRQPLKERLAKARARMKMPVLDRETKPEPVR